MNLKIEDGILLKQHALAWHDDGYSPPPAAWTPDDIDAITALAREVMAQAETIDDDTWKAAKLEAWLTVERSHHDAKQPWLGWVPVVYQDDKRVGRAYRDLFVAMNGGQCPPARDEHATYPPDGLYEFRSGKMRMIPDET